MTATSLFYWQEKLQKTDPRILCLQWQITAAKTVSPLFAGLPALTTFDAITSQSTIDNFLGTSSEFTIAQFDATSMGNDAFGVIVNMGGQMSAIGAMDAQCSSGTGLATIVTRRAIAGTLTASTLETAVQIGSSGNLGLKIDFGNTPDFDGLTSGLIVVEVSWVAK